MCKLVASMKITITQCKGTEIKFIKMDNLQIPEVNVLMDGGVYLFAIDKLPLYVGETYNFYVRFSEHLVALDDDIKYFGLSELEGEYCLEFYIIEGGYPYEPIKLNENKRYSDKNKGQRTALEAQYINKYFPMTQQLPVGCSIGYICNKKYDGMISDGKDNIVKTILENPNKNGYSDNVLKIFNECLV